MDRLDQSLDDMIKARSSGGGKAPGKARPNGGAAAGARSTPYGRSAGRGGGGGGGGRGGFRPPATGGCRVFVGNLSWQTSWQTLKDVMRTAGEVIRVDVATEPSGRSKGYALVDFANAAGAAAAIDTLRDYELDGRLLLIREDGARPGHDGQAAGQLQQPTRTVHAVHSNSAHVYGSAAVHGGGGHGLQDCRVFIGNLDWQVGWQDLKDVLRQAGEVAHVDVLTEANGRSKGCAIAQFVHPAGALAAINNLQDVQVGSRAIWLREDREAPPAATHGGGHGHGGAHGGAHAGGGGGVEVHKRVYVGNLAYPVTAADLEPLMRSAGKVVSIRVLTEPDGRSKGCAIVEFSNVNAAYKAIATLRDVEVRGRPIFLREDREP